MYVEKTKRKCTETLTVINISGRFMAFVYLFFLVFSIVSMYFFSVYYFLLHSFYYFLLCIFYIQEKNKFLMTCLGMVIVGWGWGEGRRYSIS